MNRYRTVSALALVIVGLFVATTSALGDSVLFDWAPNHATLDTVMHLKYEDIYGFGTRDVSSASGPHVIANSHTSSHYDSIATPPTLWPGGGGVPGKDYITGRLEFALDFGAPVLSSTLPDDTFDINIGGSMSAMDAFNSSGHESDAIVEAKAVSSFYIDASHGGGTPGLRVGYLLFPKLTLRPFDSALEIHVTETDPATGIHATTSYIGPHPDVAQPLLGDRFYDVTFVYGAFVPYGVDPYYECPYSYTTSYSNPYGSSWVPEPSALALCCVGLFGWGCMRRRRLVR